MKNGIFEVDVKGLRQLQEGKPKWFIIRELLQNAMDEPITECRITMKYESRKAHITVEDDSPIGFRDLSDAYTLFKDTYKRSDVKKRGRFNFGEKQVLCMADYARIVTTTGGLEFDVLGGERTTLRRKREKGSEVYVVVRMSREEFNECKDYCSQILKPADISMYVFFEEGFIKPIYYAPHKTFEATLPTEVKEDDRMKTVRRETTVNIHKPLTNACFIYEMGIPICEIDCDYSIDIQQKVPMSNDRDKVDGKYLKDIFALVLNNVIDEIERDDISQTWIREAFDSKLVDAETVQEVKDKRFGEKAVIFNPNDPVANDEAISQGYKLIYGSEMGSNEWSRMKEDAQLVSSSKMFGMGTATDAEEIKKEEKHKNIEYMTKKIAAQLLNLNVTCSFFKSRQATVLAQYGNEHISFNVTKIPGEWFEPDRKGYVSQEMLDLIIHELGHSEGMHVEHSYHNCLTRLGAKCTRKALYQPDFFKL